MKIGYLQLLIFLTAGQLACSDSGGGSASENNSGEDPSENPGEDLGACSQGAYQLRTATKLSTDENAPSYQKDDIIHTKVQQGLQFIFTCQKSDGMKDTADSAQVVWSYSVKKRHRSGIPEQVDVTKDGFFRFNEPGNFEWTATLSDSGAPPFDQEATLTQSVTVENLDMQNISSRFSIITYLPFYAYEYPTSGAVEVPVGTTLQFFIRDDNGYALPSGMEVEWSIDLNNLVSNQNDALAIQKYSGTMYSLDELRLSSGSAPTAFDIHATVTYLDAQGNSQKTIFNTQISLLEATYIQKVIPRIVNPLMNSSSIATSSKAGNGLGMYIFKILRNSLDIEVMQDQNERIGMQPGSSAYQMRPFGYGHIHYTGIEGQQELVFKTTTKKDVFKPSTGVTQEEFEYRVVHYLLPDSHIDESEQMGTHTIKPVIDQAFTPGDANTTRSMTIQRYDVVVLNSFYVPTAAPDSVYVNSYDLKGNDIESNPPNYLIPMYDGRQVGQMRMPVLSWYAETKCV